VDFDLTEEQEMLRNTAREFLSKECPTTLAREMAADEKGYPPELWRKMADLGWLGLVIPEKYDGMGMGFMDLVVLLEEMGRACLPGPFFSTAVLGGFTILEAGSDKQKSELLTRVSSGDLMLTLALIEPGARYEPAAVDLSAALNKDHYVLSGTKLFVENAHIADYIITVARTNKEASPEKGISLFLVDARSQGISIALQDTIAGDKQCEVIYDSVRVPKGNLLGKLDQGWPAMEKVLEKATAALCAQMVGGAQATLEMSVNYAKERVQFGQPIGSFQAIQHHCADMLIDVDGCRFITYQAAWRISEGLPAAREVSMAKSFVGEAYRRITLLGHRIHGGIGFCMDHDMPLYFKRAWSSEPTFNDSYYHREVVARQLGL
jgi:alkylation response protein AidB-like acyl-CoA dehydrogenase